MTTTGKIGIPGKQETQTYSLGAYLQDMQSVKPHPIFITSQPSIPPPPPPHPQSHLYCLHLCIMFSAVRTFRVCETHSLLPNLPTPYSSSSLILFSTSLISPLPDSPPPILLYSLPSPSPLIPSLPPSLLLTISQQSKKPQPLRESCEDLDQKQVEHHSFTQHPRKHSQE